MIRKLLSVLLAALLVLSCTAALADDEAPAYTDAVILYTNDIHCGIDDAIGYAGLAAYAKAYENAGYQVVKVDIGDAIQGAAVGTLSKGSYIVDIMNYVGYDLATLGNHEFDYNMDTLMALKDKAEYTYVDCNFMDMEGNTIFDAYKILEVGGRKIAFVGIVTPESFTKSTPTYFQNEAGEYIYSLCEGNNGADLYAAVQNAVDAARAEGVDMVIALAHLGIDEESSPWTSSEVILNTNGIDVVLDGHSHSTIDGEYVQNKDGEDVLLTSTGTKLNNLGVLTLAADGTVYSELHDEVIFQDADTVEFINGIKANYEADLQKVVGHTDVDLITKDPATGERIVRNAETNLGDLCADGYRYLSGADIAFVNGGGVRADIPAGDITYEQVIAVHPFGNAMCTIEVTGQKILDALELSVSSMPGELGGFLQVSGISFEINMNVESSVVVDDKGMFVEVAGDRRIQNVMVGDEPIDPEKTYILASHNYMLKSAGDGYSMFTDCPVLQNEVMLDNQVLITYINEYLGGVVGEEYSDVYGQGRIVAIQAE